MSGSEEQILPSNNVSSDHITRPRSKWAFLKCPRPLRDFLQSPFLHRTVIILVLIDTTLVLIDLGHSFLSQDCGRTHHRPTWVEVLTHISLGITSLFLVEIPLNLWAFGFEHFNPFHDLYRGLLHLFDAFIIVTTFALELVLRGRGQELASLLVIFRLWRLIELVGNVAVGAGELVEEQVHALAEARKELECKSAEIRGLRTENAVLKEQLYELRAAQSQCTD